MRLRRHTTVAELRQKRRLLFGALAILGLAVLGACALYLSEQRPAVPTAPLVLDLDGDGVELRSLSGAYFDMDLDGFAERTGWVSADDGMLALDRDGNGTIDNITELLGTGGKWKTVDLHRALAAGNRLIPCSAI
jgi:hypothetical protein